MVVYKWKIVDISNSLLVRDCFTKATPKTYKCIRIQGHRNLRILLADAAACKH
jgi:hypothetical protein